MKRRSFQQFMLSNVNIHKDQRDRSVFTKSMLGTVGDLASVVMMIRTSWTSLIEVPAHIHLICGHKTSQRNSLTTVQFSKDAFIKE